MRIRTLVAAAIAAVTLSAGTASAETALSLYVNGHVDWSDLDSGAGDDDFTNGGIGGAAAFAVGHHVGVQVDADYTVVDSDLSDDDVFSGTAHLFYRTSAGLIGGFIGAASVDGDTAWGGGVEGEKYLENWTLGGALTYATIDDQDVDFWQLGGHARYFYNENLSTSIDAGYGQINPDVGDDSDVWNVGVGVGYQLSTIPVSFGAHVGYFSADDADIDGTTVSLSVGYTFTGESLHERDRTGASQGGFLSSIVGAIL